MKLVKLILVFAMVLGSTSSVAIAAAGGVAAGVNNGQRGAAVNHGQQAAQVNHGQNKGGVIRGPGQANKK